MANKVDEIRQRAGLGLQRADDVNVLLAEIDSLTKPAAPAPDEQSEAETQKEV